MEWINEWMNWWLLNRQKCNLVCWTFFWRIPNRISLFILPLFLWQDDEVVLQSVATFQKEHHKFCLAAEGLGNRICYLESTSEAKVRRKKKTSYQTLTDEHLLNIDILESCHSDPSVLPRLSTRVHLSRLFKTTTKQKLQLQVQNMADSHLQWYRVTCGGVDPVWPGPKHIKQTRFMGSVGGIGLLSAPVLSKDWLWIQWWIKRCDVEQKWSRWHRCNCLLSHQPSVTVCFL